MLKKLLLLSFVISFNCNSKELSNVEIAMNIRTLNTFCDLASYDIRVVERYGTKSFDENDAIELSEIISDYDNILSKREYRNKCKLVTLGMIYNSSYDKYSKDNISVDLTLIRNKINSYCSKNGFDIDFVTNVTWFNKDSELTASNYVSNLETSITKSFKINKVPANCLYISQGIVYKYMYMNLGSL